MSNVSSIQPPQNFLEVIGRLYKKRGEILKSSNKLTDYSFSLQNCIKREIEGLQGDITKEMNKVISDVNELYPLLENPQIVRSLAEITTVLNLGLEDLKFHPDGKYQVALIIRNALCPIVNMTRLKLTPKGIKKAYGVEIGMKDVIKLKGFFEHNQDNY